MKKILVKFCKKAVARKVFLPINKLMFQVSLRGLGILNYETEKISGEDFLLKKISEKIHPLTVFDIGANIGKYSNRVKSFSPNSTIYAFEPHPLAFQKLEIESSNHKYTAINLGCSDVEGHSKLYDRSSNEGTHSHASLYSDVIVEIHESDCVNWDIKLTTVDEFCSSKNIQRINLLKIDTEGNELKVLLGARRTIEHELIDVIHIEFNEMNVISRVFMKDFYDILPQYDFYRLLPKYLMPLGEYRALTHEIFAYQNIVAIRRNSGIDL